MTLPANISPIGWIENAEGFSQLTPDGWLYVEKTYDGSSWIASTNFKRIEVKATTSAEAKRLAFEWYLANDDLFDSNSND